MNSSLIDDSNEMVDISEENISVLHRYASFICSLIMCACCVIGIFGNTISLIIFTRKCMRSPINVLLAGLSFVDLFVVIFAVPVFVTPGIGVFYFHYGQIDISDDPEREAAYYRFVERLYTMIVFGIYQLNMIAQTCSVWTCVVICSERYLAVCRPFVAQRYSTVNRARAVQFSIFLSAIAYNFVRFFEYESNPESGSFQRRLRNNPFYIYIYYTVLYLLTHFLIPFLIITITNVLILRAMRRAHTLRRMMTSHKSSRPPLNNIGNANGSNLPNTNRTRRDGEKFETIAVRKNGTAAIRQNGPTTNRQRQNGPERQTSRVIVVVTIMFALCNTLSFIISIWEAFDLDLFVSEAAPVAYLLLDLSNVLVVFNSASTFCFYLRYCTKYRRLFFNYCAILSSYCACFRTPFQRENLEISNGFSEYHQGTGRTSQFALSAAPLSRRSTKMAMMEGNQIGQENKRRSTFNSRPISYQTSSIVPRTKLSVRHSSYR